MRVLVIEDAVGNTFDKAKDTQTNMDFQVDCHIKEKVHSTVQITQHNFSQKLDIQKQFETSGPEQSRQAKNLKHSHPGSVDDDTWEAFQKM